MSETRHRASVCLTAMVFLAIISSTACTCRAELQVAQDERSNAKVLSSTLTRFMKVTAPADPRLAWVLCYQKVLALYVMLAILASMNSKHTKTLNAVFAKPVASNIKFADIESLVIGLGGEVREGDGSRVALLLNGGVKHAHRPHPGKEAKQYQIKALTLTGVDPPPAHITGPLSL